MASKVAIRAMAIAFDPDTRCPINQKVGHAFDQKHAMECPRCHTSKSVWWESKRLEVVCHYCNLPLLYWRMLAGVKFR